MEGEKINKEDRETNGWKERRWRRKTQKQKDGRREDKQGRQINKWMEREEMDKEEKV
jgi:hypothetical protein